MTTERDATCWTARATLRIAGDHLVIDEVTSVMGVLPDAAREKNYLVRVFDRVIAQPTGVWAITSRAEAGRLERSVGTVLDLAERDTAALMQLVRDRHLRIDVICLWIGRHGHGGPTFRAQTLRRIAQLGASLILDVYDINWGPPKTELQDLLR